MTEDFENEGTVTIADLLDQHVQTREDTMQLLRTRWIHQVLLQLISARIDADLTQAELAHRLDRHQSAIGRLERSEDIKLSTLFDYLAAVGQIPTGKIHTVSVMEAFARVTRAAGPMKEQELPTFPIGCAEHNRYRSMRTRELTFQRGGHPDLLLWKVGRSNTAAHQGPNAERQ